MREDFMEYLEEYKKYSLNVKKDINVHELKEILGSLELLCNSVDIKPESFLNREVLDIKDKKYFSDDDYNEALFVYLSDIKNYLGVFGEWFADNAFISENELN